MIAEWAGTLPVLLTALALVLLPGFAVARAFDVRGLAALAVSGPLSIAVAAVAAVVFGWTGIPWSPVSLAIAFVVVVGAAWGLRRVTRTASLPIGDLAATRDVRDEAMGASRRPGRWIVPVGVLLGVVFGIWRLAAYIEDPAGISQTNDAVFHMNAVQYILDTSNASSMHVSSVIGARGFYPAAWHSVVSMIVALTGAGIPIAANAFTLVIGAVIWTLGLSWFARTITASDTVAALTAILSGALQLFPLLLFQWGVLFPNALSAAMLPAVAAAVMNLPRWWSSSTALRSWLQGTVLVGGGAAAIALAQPATLLVLGLVVVLWFSDRMLRFPPGGSRQRGLLLAAAAWLLLAVFWFALSRGTGGSHWPPFRGKAEVLLDVFLNGQMRIHWAYVVSILMLVGLVVVWRRRDLRWLAFLWIGISVLYMLVAAVGMPAVRNVLLGAWYADPYRISAYAPLVVIPLAAIGLDRIARLAERRLAGQRAVRVPAAIATATVLMLGIVLLRPIPMPAFIEGTFDAESRYLTKDDTYLDGDERALLSDLDRYVESGARVLGNPGTGTGFGYMLSGVDVFPRTWSPPRTTQWQILAKDLKHAADDPSVCEALSALGSPEYVLDFGPGEDGPGRFVMSGMTGFEKEDGFELVARRGDAALWRITACPN